MRPVLLSPEREQARTDVLRVIALSGPCSRTAIAAALDVSAATVTAVTRELLADGLIEPAGKEPNSSRGRPAELLRIVPGAATLLGAKVARSSLTGIAADLLGETGEGFVAGFDATVADPTAALGDVLAPHVEAAGGRLLGIGLGVPGIVDVERGHVTAPTLGWRDLPVGPQLSARFGLPVVVDNDVHTLAIAEHLHGRARDVDDTLTVTIGRGVGLAITAGGRLVRGAHGGAGELGHTLADRDGPACPCGRRGCLEAIVADPALVATAERDGLLPPGATIDDLRTAADAGNARALEVFARAGATLGTAVGDLVHLLAPSLVLVSGEGTQSWPHLEASFTAALEERRQPTHASLDVVVDPWDDRDWARGAAALLLGSVHLPERFGAPAGMAARTRLHARGGEPDGR